MNNFQKLIIIYIYTFHLLVKDTFATDAMLSHAIGVMASVDYRSFSLHNLRNLMIATESRLNSSLRKVHLISSSLILVPFFDFFFLVSY